MNPENNILVAYAVGIIISAVLIGYAYFEMTKKKKRKKNE